MTHLTRLLALLGLAVACWGGGFVAGRATRADLRTYCDGYCTAMLRTGNGPCFCGNVVE